MALGDVLRFRAYSDTNPAATSSSMAADLGTGNCLLHCGPMLLNCSSLGDQVDGVWGMEHSVHFPVHSVF